MKKVMTDTTTTNFTYKGYYVKMTKHEWEVVSAKNGKALYKGTMLGCKSWIETEGDNAPEVKQFGEMRANRI